MPAVKWYEFKDSTKLWEAISIVIHKDLDKACEDVIHEFENYADNQLRQGDFTPAVGAGAFNTGDLAGSWVTDFKFLDKSILNNAPYVEAIEFGTPPRRKPPPREPIEYWTWTKLKVRGLDWLKVAESIRWTIALKGTKPRPFFRRSFEYITQSGTLNKILNKYFL